MHAPRRGMQRHLVVIHRVYTFQDAIPQISKSVSGVSSVVRRILDLSVVRPRRTFAPKRRPDLIIPIQPRSHCHIPHSPNTQRVYAQYL